MNTYTKFTIIALIYFLNFSQVTYEKDHTTEMIFERVKSYAKNKYNPYDSYRVAIKKFGAKLVANDIFIKKGTYFFRRKTDLKPEILETFLPKFSKFPKKKR